METTTKMIDIHNHIIYGVDDGSKSIDESLKMVDMYIESGFSEIIATSHYDKGRYLVDPLEIKHKIDVLNRKIKEKSLDFTIYPGHEIQVDVDINTNLKEGRVLSLNNSRYLLCELSFLNKPNFLEDLFYNLQLEGYTPIIAHAERYDYVKKDPDYLAQFIQKGALVQVNYSSIKTDPETVKTLLEKNMVHILATDAHQSEWRKPDIREYINLYKEIIGDENFIKLSMTNPKKVIEDKFIDNEFVVQKEELPKKKEKKLFGFWRRK